jgi:hypothetical protein
MLALVGQVSQQDLSQPTCQLGPIFSVELLEIALRLEQCFLDQIGRVEARPQLATDAGAGQQPQELAVPLQDFAEGMLIAGAC